MKWIRCLILNTSLPRRHIKFLIQRHLCLIGRADLINDQAIVFLHFGKLCSFRLDASLHFLDLLNQFPVHSLLNPVVFLILQWVTTSW